jgi:hypothetical protein
VPGTCEQSPSTRRPATGALPATLQPAHRCATARHVTQRATRLQAPAVPAGYCRSEALASTSLTAPVGPLSRARLDRRYPSAAPILLADLSFGPECLPACGMTVRERSIVLGILRTLIAAFRAAAFRWMEDWRRQLWRSAANERLRPAPFLRNQVMAATRTFRSIKVKAVTIRADETDQLRHVGIVV